jgi:glycosyltransferase involved in cell wall biosynthesis
MKFSIIIPCLNAADTIGEQLQALTIQSWNGQWEVIISDNGSTDDTLKVVEKYRESLPELRVVDSSDKLGAAHARNKACDAATGEAFLFCDADDVVGKDWLASIAKGLSKFDFVAGSFEGEKLNESDELQLRMVPQTNGLQEYNYPKYLPHAGGGNLGAKRTVHEAVGGFDESLPRLMDTDYCWRIQLSGVKLHFVQEAVLHVRMRKSKAGSLNQARLWGKYNVLIYKRYRPMGMPEINWKKGVRKWRFLIRHVHRIHSRLGFEKWLWQVAWQLGRLEGCFRYRVIAP